jgi:hypothetical protein
VLLRNEKRLKTKKRRSEKTSPLWIRGISPCQKDRACQARRSRGKAVWMVGDGKKILAIANNFDEENNNLSEPITYPQID